MASEFQQKKYAQFFMAVDTDGNNIVDESDFMLQIDRLAEIRNMDINSDVIRNEHKNMHQWWQNFSKMVDTDGDGKLSKSEIVAFWSHIADQAATEAQEGKSDTRNMVVSSAESTFEVLDENHDNSVTIDEYKHWLESWGVDTDAETAFASMAGSIDSPLSKEQVVECVLNFFFSTDEGAVGTNLYGVLKH